MGQPHGKPGRAATAATAPSDVVFKSVIRTTAFSDALVGRRQSQPPQPGVPHPVLMGGMMGDATTTRRSSTTDRPNSATTASSTSNANNGSTTTAPAARETTSDTNTKAETETRQQALEGQQSAATVPPTKPDPETASTKVEGSGVQGTAGPTSAACVVSEAEDSSKVMPVVIRFKPPQQVAPNSTVSILIEANRWVPIRMSPSGSDFFAIVALPPGKQAFKFSVNGEELVDPAQDQRTANGVPANVLTVASVVIPTHEETTDAVDASEGWGQEHYVFDETRKFPPVLPPHLRYTPLNTPPTQHRFNADGKMSPTDEAAFVLDPEHLPLPLTVTINHVYYQRREEHTVLGMTTRVRNKFTTVVYYKGKNDDA